MTVARKSCITLVLSSAHNIIQGHHKSQTHGIENKRFKIYNSLYHLTSFCEVKNSVMSRVFLQNGASLSRLQKLHPGNTRRVLNNQRYGNKLLYIYLNKYIFKFNVILRMFI